MSTRIVENRPTVAFRGIVFAVLAVAAVLAGVAAVAWTAGVGAPAVVDYPALHEAVGEAFRRIFG